MATPEELAAERARLEGALKSERVTAALERHSVPDHFEGLLTELPVEKIDDAARALAAEIGHPAGSEGPRSEDGGVSPASEPGGETSGEPEEFPDPLVERPELAAVSKSGADGGEPPDAGPLNARDARSEAIRSTQSWDELEALQAQSRRR
ncbi:MAG: hypothetical protein ACRDHJ_03780 [Actinomycetota bacterium]